MTKALDRQVGGKHYRDMAIQPAEYIMRNGIRFAEGCVIKYVSRWRDKGGVEDLRKAAHFLEMLIEYEIDPVETRLKLTYPCQGCANDYRGKANRNPRLH